MSLEWRARFGGVPLVQWLAILFVIGLGLFPITLALLRLWAVTGITPLGALTTVHEQPGAVEAFRFSLLEAAASTGITVAIGLPLAWAFGRYQWRNIRLKRALLFLPFVTPPVVAAVGFLALISPGGFLYNLGFDLRGETGFIGWLSSVTGGRIRVILSPWWVRTCGSICP